MFEQDYTFLIFIGLAIKSVGFMIRDELLLRSLVLTGMFFDFAFYFLQSPPIWGSVMTNAALISVNAVLVVVIMIERSSLFMTRHQRKVYAQLQTLSPGQFRRIYRWANWKTASAREELLSEGKEADRLFFIDAESFEITKQGQAYTAGGPAFAGEIMLLQGGPASASVAIARDTRYAEWSVAKLRRAMQKSKPLENALIARFGHDLADKVRNSVPLKSARG